MSTTPKESVPQEKKSVEKVWVKTGTEIVDNVWRQMKTKGIPKELIVLPSNHVRFQTIKKCEPECEPIKWDKCEPIVKHINWDKCEPKCEPFRWDNIGEDIPHATMKAKFVDEQVETTTMVRTYVYTVTH